ncbi:MAG: hypothetical protein K2M56_04080 [Muribaculaceae bacterium]|nr:hypothetical protein [Muribaculaceae bacterium]
MSKNNLKLPDVPADLATPNPRRIKGLTISEIRYQRALVALQKEFCKEKISMSMRKLQNSSPFSKGYNPGGKSSALSKAGAIAGKILGGMNYLDYAIIGFSAFSNVRKILGLFKKKK